MYLFWGRDLAITCIYTQRLVRDGTINISALSNLAVRHVLIAEVAQHNYKRMHHKKLDKYYTKECCKKMYVSVTALHAT